MAFPGFPGGNGNSSFTAASAAAFTAVFFFRRWWCLRCATVTVAAAKAAGADEPSRVPGALSAGCACEHATDNTPEGVFFSDGATNNMANEYNDFLRRNGEANKLLL